MHNREGRQEAFGAYQSEEISIHPNSAKAMERGQVSYAKVRALTRVACPATEDYLLSIALHGTAHHVETLVRHFRRLKQAEELSREAQQQANRFLRYRWGDDGSFILNASLPAETGALVLKALEAAVEESPTPKPAKEMHVDHVPPEDPIDRPSRAVQRADALGLLAESFIEHGAAAMSGDRHQIIVHVSAETLRANAMAKRAKAMTVMMDAARSKTARRWPRRLRAASPAMPASSP